MLIGTYEHSVDAKGRLFIPAKWRDDLGSTMIVTRGFTGKGDYRCLTGMSIARFEQLMEKYNNVPLADIVTQNALRKLFAMACECELDKQGRILVSNQLREIAALDKDVALLGQGKRFEIWDKARWDERQAKDNDVEDSVLAHLAGLGI